MYHQMINIQNHSLTIGVIGDATQGEWTQYQYTNTGGTLYNFGHYIILDPLHLMIE
jgi:hypothetical protein